jgi:hypothetical protein
MQLRLDERLTSPYFSPVGDARAPYETHGTTFLQYLARRAAKTRALLPLKALLLERRAGGPEYAGALACFAYYAAAASTSYGRGYQQPNFTSERVAEERDRETDALISATNTGANREIAASLRLILPKIGIYESSERILGTTVGIRGLGMPAPSTFAFEVDSGGRRAGLAAWRGTARGTITTELAPSFSGSRVRGYGALDLHGSDGSRGRAEITRDGIARIEVRDASGTLLHLNGPLR